jgi:poly-gamma-glutamate synthesis protein (capsule biosynthesis protein)
MKSKIKVGFFAISSVFVGILLASLAFNSLGYEKISESENITNSANGWEKTNNRTKQEHFYFIKNPKNKPNILAEAYLVGDLDTGEIIFSKNREKVFPIASVSKLMTALVSLDKQDQEKTIEISKKILATEGENGNLRLGEKIKVGDLLYPMLLESSNDSAEAIASSIGRDNFVEEMNVKAKNLKMTYTSFKDPTGLSEQNLSNVFDLFKLSEYLNKNKPEVLEISKLKSFNNKKHVWFNNSQFLGIPGYQGGKRGYIDESRQTVIASFALPVGSSDTRNISITLLRSEDRLRDINNLLKYISKNIYYGKDDDAKMEWVKQREGTVEDFAQNFVTFIFGGDIMLDRGVKNSVMKNFEGDYSDLFNKLEILKKVDITFANLEGTASDKGTDMHNLYSFHMDPSTVPAMKGAGISILSLANNHVGDWGRDAYIDTLKRLDENEILYTGGGINKFEATRPTIIEKYGIKIGFLGFSDVGPSWMEVGETEPGLLLASDPNFDEIVRNAASLVDHLVVSFHFGDEYKTKHNARQEFLAHKAVDNGAKIVIGHHPHVIQDTEVYKNGFIAYSLGNFIFDQRFSEATMQGMLLEIKLDKSGSMVINKNIVKLNSVFQPDQIIKGKNEVIKFDTKKIPTSQ